MIFKHISLRQFRNIEVQNISLNSGLNIFRGQNGQGKTNLIEALYLMTHGRSFRTSRLEDLINKQDFQGFYLDAEITKKDLDYSLKMRVSGRKKTLQVNNQKYSAPKLRQNFPALLFSPESLLIVKDSAQKRRTLIDDLCLTLFPKFSALLIDYQRLLKQKNTLLKTVRDNQIGDKEGKRLVKNITQLLFEKGSWLTYLRIKAIEEIQPLLLQEFLEIMDDHYGNIAINYIISGQKIKDASQSKLLNAMYKRWDELKARELASGLCLVGPHKHDIQFDFNDQEARFYCSQGQQRAIVLAFKMAQTRLHYRTHKEFPILLLDDVLSELDKEKQMRFMNYLLSTEAQIFLTTTDATIIPTVALKAVFEVKDGCFIESDRLLTGGLNV